MPRLGVSLTRDAIQCYLKESIDEQLQYYLNKIIKQWGEKCNIDLKYLETNYNTDWIHVQVDKLQTKIIKKKLEQEKRRCYINNLENGPRQDERCCARTWSDPPLVLYDVDSKKWILGEQCTRKQKRNGLCGIHMRNLPHGRINEEPPHNKFERYKKKVILAEHGPKKID